MKKYWTLNIPKPPRHFSLIVVANILMVVGIVVGIGGIGGTENGGKNLLFGIVTSCLGGGMCLGALYLVKLYESRSRLDYDRGEESREVIDRTLAKQVGNRLKNLRQKRGYSPQSNVAELIGVSRYSLIKYENGDMMPSAQTLIDIADFYGVSVDYILGREAKDESRLQNGQKAFQNGSDRTSCSIFKKS